MTTERISLDQVELPTALLHRALGIIRGWRERSQARRTLARFDARMLEDIGITEADAWRETRLPFWRAQR